MNPSCVICCTEFTSSDDIYATPCKHVYHLSCLNQWFERSKTCPECRKNVTRREIYRLHLNFAEDDDSLQKKIADLQSQLIIRDKSITDFAKLTAKLQSQFAEASYCRAQLHEQIGEMQRENLKLLNELKQANFAYNYVNLHETERLKLQLEHINELYTKEVANSANLHGEIRELRNELKEATIAKFELAEELKKSHLAYSKLSETQQIRPSLQSSAAILKPQITTNSNNNIDLMTNCVRQGRKRTIEEEKENSPNKKSYYACDTNVSTDLLGFTTLFRTYLEENYTNMKSVH